MKKSVAMIALFVLGMILVSSLVSADPVNNFAKLIDDFVKGVEPIAKYILGATEATSTYTAGELLFAKVLFLLIVLAIIYFALEQIDAISNNTWILWIISVAASILAVRYLGNALVPTIILPYSVLGVAISAGLPFVIYSIVVTKGLSGPGYKTVRRIAWILFGVVFLVLWATRADDLQEGAWIYLLTALGALIMIILDGTLQRFLVQIRIEKSGKTSAEEAIIDLRAKKVRLNQLLAEGVITEAEKRKRDKLYTKQIAALTK